jgi:lipopolysaccharide transport system ATP-binding protein
MYLESLFEVQQDITEFKPISNILFASNFKDQRHEILNASALRNDIKLFSFGLNSKQFGSGGARIVNVFFTDLDGHSLSWFVGGENVILQILIETLTTLDAPIVGFYIKDKVGQHLFGDNTYITTQLKPVICAENQILKVAFHFQMPRLAVGDYSVAVAVANGTQDDHVQHHWIHDAVTFRSERSSVVGGLVGIPMAAIEIIAS